MNLSDSLIKLNSVDDQRIISSDNRLKCIMDKFAAFKKSKRKSRFETVSRAFSVGFEKLVLVAMAVALPSVPSAAHEFVAAALYPYRLAAYNGIG